MKQNPWMLVSRHCRIIGGGSCDLQFERDKNTMSQIRNRTEAMNYG